MQKPNSAIRDGRDSSGNPFDTSNFNVLANASCTVLRSVRILDSYNIYKTMPVLKNQLGSYPSQL